MRHVGIQLKVVCDFSNQLLYRASQTCSDLHASHGRIWEAFFIYYNVCIYNKESSC